MERPFRSTPPCGGRLSVNNILKNNVKTLSFCEPNLSNGPTSAQTSTDFGQVIESTGVRTSANCGARLGFASYEKKIIGILGGFRSDMFDSSTPFASQEIKSQAVRLWVDRFDQACAHRGPERRIDIAFKNRVLDPLAVIFADASHAPQTFRAAGPRCHVICNQYQHLPYPGRVGIEVATKVAGKQLCLHLCHQTERHPLVKPGMSEFHAFSFVIGL